MSDTRMSDEEFALVREILGNILARERAALEREQRALVRHATERSEILGRLRLVEDMVAQLLIAARVP